MNLERYYLVLLRRPPEHPDLSADEVAQLQVGHLAFHDRMRAEGLVAFNGPLREGDDSALRGLACYRTDSADEARRLAQGDPMVQAHWLAVEVHEFWTQPGAIGQPGTPIEI